VGGYTVNGTATGPSATIDARGATKITWTAATSGQYAGVVATGPFDLSAGDRFAIDVEWDKADQKTGILIYLANGATGYSNYALYEAPADSKHYKRTTINIPKSSFATTGTVNWAAIDRIEVRFQRYTADMGVASLYLYGFWSNVTARPKVLLTFDDGAASMYSRTLGIMQAAGLRGTMYVVPTFIGDYAGYLTLTQLREMYAAGWDAASHTMNHTHLAAVGSYTRSGDLATFTLPSNNPHGKTVGSTVTIAGADEAAFNGTFTITGVPNPHTLNFNLALPSGSTTGYGHPYIVGHQSQAVREAAIGDARDWLLANGFPRAAKHIAYPYGEWDPAVLTVAAAEGVITGRHTSNVNGSYVLGTVNGIGNVALTLPSYSIDQRTAVTVLARVDEAISKNGTIILIGHDVTDGTPGASQTAQAEFQAMVDGIKARRDAGQIDVVTISEWFNRL
jgi:peptidoglycan/xylan/chitin deacetylase (PgdA/CDA1 family)